MPEMTRVLSSHVLDVGYDDAGFWVRYAPSVKEPRGALVVYRDVPPEIAERVFKAPSIGSAIYNELRGRYEFDYPERDPDALPTEEVVDPMPRVRQKSGRAQKERRQKW